MLFYYDEGGFCVFFQGEEGGFRKFMYKFITTQKKRTQARIS